MRERVTAGSERLGPGGGQAERVRDAAARILVAMAAAGKGPRWRLRALIGERLSCCDAVDEDDGQRIGLRERPAGAPGAARRASGA